MMRRFQFEAEIYESLSCVPMAVRRKLDRIGTKIGLQQWQQLERAERLMICHAPADSAEECAVLRLFIDEATLAHCGVKPHELPEEARAGAHPPTVVPQELVASAAQAGVTLTQPLWERLDEDQRYALIKLGAGSKHSHNLKAALAEFLPAETASAAPRG